MKNIDPCQLNAAVAMITNQLYCSLSRDEFLNLGIALSMLSKDMLAMVGIEELLRWEHRDIKRERLREERRERQEHHQRHEHNQEGHQRQENQQTSSPPQ